MKNIKVPRVRCMKRYMSVGSCCVLLFNTACSKYANTYNMGNNPRNNQVRASQGNAHPLIQQQPNNISGINNRYWQSIDRSVNSGDENHISLLIEKAGDLNLQNARNGWTVLHYATNYRRYNIAGLLIDKEANANIQDNNGYTALHLAVKQQDYDIVQLLTNEGKANLNIKDISGYTALHWARKKGYNKIVDLLKKAAKVNKRDKNSQTFTDHTSSASKGSRDDGLRDICGLLIVIET